MLLQYVRVSDEDDLNKLKELMMDYWNLIDDTPPLLCVSVIGGAKSFRLKGLKKEIFCKVIIKLNIDSQFCLGPDQGSTDY